MAEVNETGLNLAQRHSGLDVNQPFCLSGLLARIKDSLEQNQ
jgi:hypothetical protein